MLCKMDQLGFGGRIFNWVQSFLSGCTMHVHIGSVLYDPVEVENGTPQGGVISLILLVLAINNLRLKGIKVSIFADDTAIWETGKDVVWLTTRIQVAMDSIQEWCVSGGLKCPWLRHL